MGLFLNFGYPGREMLEVLAINEAVILLISRKSISGIKWLNKISAYLTQCYQPSNLVGRQIFAVVNFPCRITGEFNV